MLINLYGQDRYEFKDELKNRLIDEGSTVLVLDSIRNYLAAKGIDPETADASTVLENKIIELDSELMRVDERIDYIISTDPLLYTTQQTGAGNDVRNNALKVAKSYNQFNIITDRKDKITNNIIEQYGSNNIGKDGVYFGNYDSSNIDQALINIKAYKNNLGNASKGTQTNTKSNWETISKASQAIKNEVSILEIAKDAGFDLIRVSSNVYTTTQHDSLRFFADTNSYSHFSRAGEPNSQGDIYNFVMGYIPEVNSYHNALKYVAAHYATQYDLNDAASLSKYLKDYKDTALSRSKRPSGWQNVNITEVNNDSDPFSRRKELEMPKPADNNDEVMSYLTNKRGIDQSIVQRWINKKLLYQDIHGNCVFCGYAGTLPLVRKDNSDSDTYLLYRTSSYSKEISENRVTSEQVNFIPFHARNMSIRAADENEKIQKRDVKGSEKIFGIWCNSANGYKQAARFGGDIYFTESAIDAMPLQTMLGKEALSSSNFISINGVTNLDCISYWCQEYLQNPKAVEEIQNIYIAFDNDAAGRKAAAKAEQIIKHFFNNTSIQVLTPHKKDFNEELINSKNRQTAALGNQKQNQSIEQNIFPQMALFYEGKKKK